MKQIVPYELELANTWEDLYAHVHLKNVDIGPGDEVLIQQAPTQLAWGEKYTVTGDALYTKASFLQKIWTRLFSRFELTMLYEVSFSSSRFSHRQKNKYPQQPADTYASPSHYERREI